jgi:hypothetical protein
VRKATEKARSNPTFEERAGCRDGFTCGGGERIRVGLECDGEEEREEGERREGSQPHGEKFRC